MPLTDTAIRNAKPADRPVRLFDAGGLYLEVAPSGDKWLRLKYRYGGKEKRLSLGVYPDVSLKDARERRDCQSASKVDPLSACNFDPVAQRDCHGAVRFGLVGRYPSAVNHRIQAVLSVPSWRVGARSAVGFAL